MGKKFRLCLAAVMAVGLSVATLSTASAAGAQEVGESQFPAIDLEAYDGVWYEMARTPNSFQDNIPDFFGIKFSPCLDTMVEYRINPAGYIDLTNSCTRVNEEFGWEYPESIDGSAFPVAGENGKLKVAFGPAPFPAIVVFFGGGGNYWVYEIGPIVDGEYQWAVVGGATLDADLFIITRDRVAPPALQEEILAAASAQGLPVDQLVYRQR